MGADAMPPGGLKELAELTAAPLLGFLQNYLAWVTFQRRKTDSTGL